MNLPVGSHENLDVSSRIKSVQLIDQFQHGPLHFIVTTGSIIETSSTNSVNFIEKDDTGLLAPSHLEQLSDHPGAFSDIFLHKLRTDDPNEGCVSPISNRSCTERLACSGWAE
jgi:hypothetical protein